MLVKPEPISDLMPEKKQFLTKADEWVIDELKILAIRKKVKLDVVVTEAFVEYIKKNKE